MLRRLTNVFSREKRVMCGVYELSQRRMYMQSRNSCRSYSIFSNIRTKVSNKLEERNQTKAANMYKEQIRALADSDQFNLDTMLQYLKKQERDSGMSGWRSMIPGVSDMQHVKQLKSAIGIIDLIQPKLRAKPELITGKTKRMLLENMKSSAEDLNNVLRQYEQLNALRLWIIRRVERNLPLPETQEETSRMVQEDPTGFPVNKFRTKMKRRR